MSKREEQLSVLQDVIDELSKYDKRAAIIFNVYDDSVVIVFSLVEIREKNEKGIHVPLIEAYRPIVGEDAFNNDDWIVIYDHEARTYDARRMRLAMESRSRHMLDNILARGTAPLEPSDIDKGVGEVVQRILEIENG